MFTKIHNSHYTTYTISCRTTTDIMTRRQRHNATQQISQQLYIFTFSLTSLYIFGISFDAKYVRRVDVDLARSIFQNALFFSTEYGCKSVPMKRPIARVIRRAFSEFLGSFVTVSGMVLCCAGTGGGAFSVAGWNLWRCCRMFMVLPMYFFFFLRFRKTRLTSIPVKQIQAVKL